jgi:hypothetical protein
VHAYEKLAERCKELLVEQESWLHQVYKSTALFRATHIFQKDLVVLWVMVRVVMRFPSSALIHNKNNIIDIFGTVEFQLTLLFVLVSTKGIQATFKYYYSYPQQKYKICFWN